MANGSFSGLYTFEQVASIYNLDPSTIRKQVQFGKFTDKEIKKFGKTWIMTEKAMIEHYGAQLFNLYKQSLIIAKSKSKTKKAAKKISNNDIDYSMSCDDDDDEIVDNLEYIEVDERFVTDSFTF